MKWLAEMQLKNLRYRDGIIVGQTVIRYLYATVLVATILCNSLTMTFIATITYRMYL